MPGLGWVEEGEGCLAVLVDVGEDEAEAGVDGARADVLVAGVTIAKTPGAEGGPCVAGHEAAGVGYGHTELERGWGEVFLAICWSFCYLFFVGNENIRGR